MKLERTDGKGGGLQVGWMALALVLAAFTGAALGLVWQSAGWGEDSPPAAAEAEDS